MTKSNEVLKALIDASKQSNKQNHRRGTMSTHLFDEAVQKDIDQPTSLDSSFPVSLSPERKAEIIEWELHAEQAPDVVDIVKRAAQTPHEIDKNLELQELASLPETSEAVSDVSGTKSANKRQRRNTSNPFSPEVSEQITQTYDLLENYCEGVIQRNLFPQTVVDPELRGDLSLSERAALIDRVAGQKRYLRLILEELHNIEIKLYERSLSRMITHNSFARFYLYLSHLHENVGDIPIAYIRTTYLSLFSVYVNVLQVYEIEDDPFYEVFYADMDALGNLAVFLSKLHNDSLDVIGSLNLPDYASNSCIIMLDQLIREMREVAKGHVD